MKSDDKEITLDLKNIDQIDLSLETIQRVIDGKPLRPVDTAPLVGIKYILLKIKETTHANLNSSRNPDVRRRDKSV